MKAAIVFSPGAGGKQAFRAIAATLTEKLTSAALYTLKGGYGQDYLPAATVLDCPESGDYKLDLYAKLTLLLEQGLDLFVSVGGDGLATYAANAMHICGSFAPILGIAGGTANVGPIVSYTYEQLVELNLQSFTLRPLEAIKVCLDGEYISHAYNDVIFASTYLGSIDGKPTTLSVEQLLTSGKKVSVTPTRDIISRDFKITLNGSVIPCDTEGIAQIAVSTISRENLYGRAVYGILCHADSINKTAALCLMNTLAVAYETPAEGTSALAHNRYLLFGEADTLTLSGFTPTAAIVCDGNPYLLSQKEVTLTLTKNAISVV